MGYVGASAVFMGCNIFFVIGAVFIGCVITIIIIVVVIYSCGDFMCTNIIVVNL